MEITEKQAKADLDAIMSTFVNMGQGTENDRAAQLIMQSIDVLERRLDNVAMLKLAYIDNPKAAELLPNTVYDVVKQYVDGCIDESTARKHLQDARQQYDLVFDKMSITPKKSTVHFIK